VRWRRRSSRIRRRISYPAGLGLTSTWDGSQLPRLLLHLAGEEMGGRVPVPRRRGRQRRVATNAAWCGGAGEARNAADEAMHGAVGGSGRTAGQARRADAGEGATSGGEEARRRGRRRRGRMRRGAINAAWCGERGATAGEARRPTAGGGGSGATGGRGGGGDGRTVMRDEATGGRVARLKSRGGWGAGTGGRVCLMTVKKTGDLGGIIFHDDVFAFHQILSNTVSVSEK